MDPLITLELTFIRGDLEALRKWLGTDKAPHTIELKRLNCALEALDRIDAMAPATVLASHLVTHNSDRRA